MQAPLIGTLGFPQERMRVSYSIGNNRGIQQQLEQGLAPDAFQTIRRGLAEALSNQQRSTRYVEIAHIYVCIKCIAFAYYSFY